MRIKISMTHKEAFKSLASELKTAKTPESFFNLSGKTKEDLLADLRPMYVAGAQILHPDRNEGSASATEAFALFTALHDEAEKRIEEGQWGKPAGAVIAAGQNYTEVVLRTSGDICDVYSARYGDKRAVIKVARDPKDSDLVTNEAKVLRDLWSKTGPEAAHFQKYLPRLVEQTRLKLGGAERPANVIGADPDTYTLTQVLAKHGEALDPRHVGWIWKRILECLDWVHEQGYAHCAIVPDHVLVHPKTHGVKLIDWSYATKLGGKLRAIPANSRAYYAPEALLKEPVTSGADLYMAAKCVVRALGGDPAVKTQAPWTPKDFDGLIRASVLPGMSRYQSAIEMHGLVTRRLEDLFGKPKFVDLEM